jgi:DegV family protein with EDD domain
MSSICIITDSSAQFPGQFSPSERKIEIAPLSCRLNGNVLADEKGVTVSRMPETASHGYIPKLLPPPVEYFKEAFFRLSQDHDVIIGIFLSSLLNSCVQNAQEASTLHKGKASIQIIDSQTTSVGLGYLVQNAIDLADAGHSPVEIERKLHFLIPFIYSVFCIPGLSYLHSNGFIDKGQAIISEILGLYPIFTIENGKFSSLEKVHNHRQAMAFFQEFLDEFENLEHIALIKGPHVTLGDFHLIHEPSPGSPKPPVQEYTLSLPLATLMGPTAIGCSIIECPDQIFRPE